MESPKTPDTTNNSLFVHKPSNIKAENEQKKIKQERRVRAKPRKLNFEDDIHSDLKDIKKMLHAMEQKFNELKRETGEIKSDLSNIAIAIEQVNDRTEIIIEEQEEIKDKNVILSEQIMELKDNIIYDEKFSERCVVINRHGKFYGNYYLIRGRKLYVDRAYKKQKKIFPKSVIVSDTYNKNINDIKLQLKCRGVTFNGNNMDITGSTVEENDIIEIFK